MGLSGFNLTPTVIGVAGSLITASIIGAFKYGRDYLLGLRLEKRLEEDHYTPAEIKKFAAGNRDPYIRPDCQDNNPAGWRKFSLRRMSFPRRTERAQADRGPDRVC